VKKFFFDCFVCETIKFCILLIIYHFPFFFNSFNPGKKNIE